MDVSHIDPMDGNWVCPRLSFSHDLIQMPMELTSETQRQKLGISEEDDFSFGFSNLLNDSELPTTPATCLMLSPDELFCNGKLLPLERRHSIAGRGHARTLSMAHYPQDWFSHHHHQQQHHHHHDGNIETTLLGMSRSIQDKPRSVSMTVADSRGNYFSTSSSSNSRVSSPSTDMRATASATVTAIATMGADAAAACHMPHLRTASASIETSCSLFRPSLAAALSSSSQSSSTERYQRRKFKDFFKLRKGWTPKDHHDSTSSTATQLPPRRESSSISLPVASPSSGRVSTSKSFWPFSRSNSAGETKSPPAYSSPLPKRSNSSGEGKTTSSALLPNLLLPPPPPPPPPEGIGIMSGQRAPLRESSVGDHHSSNSQDKAPRLSFSCAASSQDELLELSAHLLPTTKSSTSPDTSNDDLPQGSSIPSPASAGACSNGLPPLPTAKTIQCCATASAAGAPPPPPPLTRHEAQPLGADHGGRLPTRRFPNSSPSRNFARSSPGRRRGIWNNSPGRGTYANGPRIAIRSLDRGGRLGRPKSVVLHHGEGQGQRRRQRQRQQSSRGRMVPPPTLPLNLPYYYYYSMPPPPATATATATARRPPASASTSKSKKVFTTLGGFFSKKERGGGRAYVLLTTTSTTTTTASSSSSLDCRNGA